MDRIRVAGIVEESIVDGPGVRYVVFTQGCLHKCRGCHNPETHPLDGGYYKDLGEIIEEVRDNPLLKGLTLSGGDPLLQVEASIKLLSQVRELGLDTVVYTGYRLEEILEDPEKRPILDHIDLLIDGRFQLENKSLNLKFRGSSNQRLIDLNKYFKR